MVSIICEENVKMSGSNSPRFIEIPEGFGHQTALEVVAPYGRADHVNELQTQDYTDLSLSELHCRKLGVPKITLVSMKISFSGTPHFSYDESKAKYLLRHTRLFATYC
jgi:hypothetical protein